MDVKKTQEMNISYTENHGDNTEYHREKYKMYSSLVLCASSVQLCVTICK